MLFWIVCRTDSDLNAAQLEFSQAPKEKPSSPIPPIFRASPASLKGSGVPFLFPKTFSPATPTEPLFMKIRWVGANGYDIVLAADDEPCEGQNVCSWGTLEGSTAPIKSSDLPYAPIRLESGIAAHYAKSVCHSQCTQGYITWKQHGFYYSIGMKAGRRRQLIDAANSAIKSKLIGPENF
jgi:hypothetical protein